MGNIFIGPMAGNQSDQPTNTDSDVVFGTVTGDTGTFTHVNASSGVFSSNLQSPNAEIGNVQITNNGIITSAIFVEDYYQIPGQVVTHLLSNPGCFQTAICGTLDALESRLFLYLRSEFNHEFVLSTGENHNQFQIGHRYKPGQLGWAQNAPVTQKSAYIGASDGIEAGDDSGAQVITFTSINGSNHNQTTFTNVLNQPVSFTVYLTVHSNQGM